MVMAELLMQYDKDSEPRTRVLLNIEERIAGLRASQDRLDATGSRNPTVGVARAIAELASLREDLLREHERKV